MSLSRTSESLLVVVVAGMPASGNRIIRALVEQNTRVAFCHIHHCGEFAKYVLPWRTKGMQVRIIMPVREPAVHELASARYLAAQGAPYAECKARHYEKTMEAAADFHIPVLPVRYRAIVEDPRLMGARIMGWLGLEFVGWPEPVYDGDKKYLEGVL